MSRDGASFFDRGIESLNLSARSAHKIVKTARTIADMEASEEIGLMHIAEAFQYRSRVYIPVSYTHLDVYKRQPTCLVIILLYFTTSALKS